MTDAPAPLGNPLVVESLVAESFDATRLRGVLEAGLSVTGTGMFVAFRDALTAGQRATLARDLLADAARKGMPVVAWPVPLPELTREQAAAFEALACRLERSLAASPGGPLEYAALACFFEYGDVAVLEANMAAARFPLEELVTFAGLLDAEQRRAIFAGGIPWLERVGKIA